ncbi:NAD(P)-binding protein [Hypoxylon rubiginosum]|uniref:NAD(P)-binding protein n=1 Tax=Hypoxylon rubiginosum TaxID=110542 RepID=A0ACB9YIG1_9PEZI|nr:NAD(P)-binding protein [Hypoxylon rubiginosum]
MLSTAIVGLLAIGVAWVWKLNGAMKETPPEVLAQSPHRWTDKEMRETYQRIKANPIDWTSHLPPKLHRRYIVTGGSGGVGGQIVLHLLARGQPPESIRIVDFRKPDRSDMTVGPAAQVDFAQADITSPTVTSAAFDKPWPATVAKLPLTIFHTAAIIAPAERSLRTYDRVKRVNIDGVRHVLDASRASGATIFISMSSASVAYEPVQFWGNPLRRWPRNYWQAIDESDFDRPLRPHARFFGNYAHAKAVSERIISAANTPAFRTGLVRPANTIYGSSKGDQVVGYYLRAGTVPSWMPSIMQNFVHCGHVSLAHLLFEAALLRGGGSGGSGGGAMPACACRPFTVTDAGPPPTFEDLYSLLRATVATPPIRLVYLPPAWTLVLAHAVEWVDLASRLPALGRAVPRPGGDLALLQPAVFSAGAHYLASDAAARRGVDEGGIGYRHVHTTMEGVCQQVLEWNIEHRDRSS